MRVLLSAVLLLFGCEPDLCESSTDDALGAAARWVEAEARLADEVERALETTPLRMPEFGVGRVPEGPTAIPAHARSRYEEPVELAARTYVNRSRLTVQWVSARLSEAEDAGISERRAHLLGIAWACREIEHVRRDWMVEEERRIAADGYMRAHPDRDIPSALTGCVPAPYDHEANLAARALQHAALARGDACGEEVAAPDRLR